MSDNNKLSKIRLLILTAAAAAGISAASGTALANNSAVSERDMVLQAVSLYEKLNGEEISVPEEIAQACGGTELGKAVVLGFANIDDIGSLSDAIALRKQDALTVLYKTIIDFDDSFALSSEEVDEILNKCYDNALIDEENRVGYAFMLKYGIISSGINTEPNKEINWTGCRILVNQLYDLFVQDVSFDVGGVSVRIGANIETVTNILGEPSRIDKGDYGYDWYVFNSDYNYFMMVGVENGRICGFFSNSRLLSFGGLKSGSSIADARGYKERDGYRFFADDDGNIDAILFNTRSKSDVIAEVSPEAAAFELADMINANRAKHNAAPLSISQSLSAEAQAMAPQAKYLSLARDMSRDHIKDGAQHETGYDTFTVYSVLAGNGGECFASGSRVIGIGTNVTDDYYVIASIITDNSANDTVKTDTAGIEALAPAAEEAEPEQETETISIAEISEIISKAESEAEKELEAEPEELEASAQDALNDEDSSDASEDEPEEESRNDSFKPASYEGVEVEEGKDFVISLTENDPDKFYVRVYSFEEDDYIVNSYISAEDGKLAIKSDAFEAGRDYAVSITPADDTGSEPKEFVISYGIAPEDSIAITSYEEENVTDDDKLELSWDCPLYSDFLIEIYDEEGSLALSQIVSNSKSANISNVKPGIYDVHISAVRRGSEDIIKAEAETKVEVKLPEPVITEYILEDGEKFYPVYADEDMGLVYFYDEDIIDVTITAGSGAQTTAQRKKLTEKQVKATDYYKLLAEKQPKVEYFTGSAERDIKVNEEDLSVITYDGMTISDNKYGAAIIAEARKYLGVPYLWGGTTPDGFDCSGLCQYVYRNVGLNISRVSQTQYLEGIHISRDNLQPGDLVFFRKNGDVHHVGIYAGDGMMIHAPYTGSYVKYESIDSDYYKSQFCGGRRILGDYSEATSED